MPLRLYFSTVVMTAAFLSLHLLTKAHGIVIADEKKQTDFFNAGSSEVIKLAEDLSSKYDRVILHLGRSYVFRTGNIYTSEMSRNNLKLFAEVLRSNGVQFTLWFLDSFGKEAFEKLYARHKEICDENLMMLDSLKIPYDGIAVDLEWVNSENGNNNSKLEETISYLRNRLEKDKKLYFFASLHDTEEENLSRGYNRELLSGNIATPIAMLYPLSSGIYLEDKKLVPNMTDKRINSLKDFYKNANWEVTVAPGDKWFCPPENKRSDIKRLITAPVYNPKHLRTNFTVRQEYWTQKGYTILRSIRVEIEEGKKK
ncbi:MAG TPA: hypothetical protein VN249_13200, partial [Prolixibacteraceae bacterium]|nr:hypothetical protein [Prolixibacteraceae bacterium]